MNDLTEHQTQTLARGLEEFERAHRRRRFIRAGAPLVVAVAVAVVAGIAAAMLLAPTARIAALPAYVELIEDDRALAEELSLAYACERFERNDGRLVVLECAAHENR
jgi:hypothetical protein